MPAAATGRPSADGPAAEAGPARPERPDLAAAKAKPPVVAEPEPPAAADPEPAAAAGADPRSSGGADLEALAAAFARARGRAEAGNMNSARTLMEDALAEAEAQLGRDDPRLVSVMIDLSTINRKLGNHAEARALLRRAYAVAVAATGPEDAESLSIEGRLAAATHLLGEPTEAYDWHLTDVGLRVLGPDHPAVRGARQRLAHAPDAAMDPVATTLPATTLPVTAMDPSATTLPAAISLEEDPLDEPGLAPTYAPPAYGPLDPGRGTQPDPDHAEPDEHGMRYEPSPYPGVFQRLGGDGVLRPQHSAQSWPAVHPPTVERRQREGHAAGSAVVALLGAAVLIAATVIAMQVIGPLLDGSGQATPSQTPPAPTTVTPSATATAAGPPTGVRIKDEGGSVTLTWMDPSDGSVAFIVAGARDGETLSALESVPAGRTTSVIYGLSTRFDYCFTVSAVWAPDMILPSMRTCTNRLSTGAAS